MYDCEYNIIVKNNDGNEYIIPFDKLNHFNNWKECIRGIVPDYAKKLNGQLIIFKEYYEVY